MNDECLEHLISVVNQACSVNCDSDMGTHLDSMASSSYADALLFLEGLGKVEVLIRSGRRVIGKWREGVL